jgi:hypothetical protein
MCRRQADDRQENCCGWCDWCALAAVERCLPPWAVKVWQALRDMTNQTRRQYPEGRVVRPGHRWGVVPMTVDTSAATAMRPAAAIRQDHFSVTPTDPVDRRRMPGRACHYRIRRIVTPRHPQAPRLAPSAWLNR